MKGRRSTSLLLSALGVAGIAGWLAWHHSGAPPAPESPVAAHPVSSRPSKTSGATAERQHREAAERQKSLARRMLDASQGKTAGLPDLSKLQAADLQDLLEALQLDLSEEPAARQVFCYQMVLGALQDRDPAAGLSSLERLSEILPQDSNPGVWTRIAGIFFSSVPPSGTATAATWLKDHRDLFAGAPGSSSTGTAYQEMSQVLAMAASHQDLDAAFHTMEALDLPRETLLPALAQQTDSRQDWTRILTELHASKDATASAGVFTAADATIGQMSATEGMTWLAALPFSSQDLENVLINLEAGPLQDPQPWLAWMESRLTPQQAARVRSEWSKRLPATTASRRSNY